MLRRYEHVNAPGLTGEQPRIARQAAMSRSEWIAHSPFSPLLTPFPLR